jgi:type III secretion protein W
MAEPNISRSIPVSAQTVRMIQQEVAAENAMQIESEEDLNQFFELSLFNPLLQAQRFRNFKEIKSEDPKKLKEAEEDKRVFDIEQIEEAASRFQKNNYEINAKVLQILRQKISDNDTLDTLLEKVFSVYGDASLADEALDFLLETTTGSLRAKVLAAKGQFNEERGREIRAGRNMGAQAREFSKEGLGSPTSLRDLYRDITGNPREALKLFEELTDKFSYVRLKPALTFLLHSLGSDLKAKGPSIARGELKRLLDETRSLQGILGVFRFFQSRMRLIEREFSSYDLTLPARLDFEQLAKMFIRLLAERYMNPDKILQTAKFLGIDEEEAAQIIIYTQMRDALKQIAPRYYRNTQHRDELQKSFIDAIEKLEDKMEEEEEEK